MVQRSGDDRFSMATAGRPFLAAAAIALCGAQAPPSAPAPDDQIVITGTRLTPEQARTRAAEFVRLTGVAAGHRPAARWLDPACLRISGLVPSQAQLVEAEIRRIAEAADVPVASGECRTSLVVHFAADAGAVVRDIAARSPTRLNEVPTEARGALLNGSAPVRWWYTTDTRSRHGTPGRGNPPLFAKIDGGAGGGSGIPASVPSILHYDSSMISTQANRFLTSATIIVDANLAAGRPLDSIAAYAAMVAFAEIRTGAPAPSDSILGLFEPANATQEYSEHDAVFLRALYRLTLDREARNHRGRLLRELADSLVGS
jgi:hypothetical protein